MTWITEDVIKLKPIRETGSPAAKNRDVIFAEVLKRFWERFDERARKLRLPENLKRAWDEGDVRAEAAAVMWRLLSQPRQAGKGIWARLEPACGPGASEVFYRYFTRVVYNCCASRSRKAIREKAFVRGASALGPPGEDEIDALAEMPDDDDMSPVRAAESEESRALLLAAVKSLPPGYSQIVELRFIECRTRPETAAILEQTVHQVRRKEEFALRKLKDMLPELAD